MGVPPGTEADGLIGGWSQQGAGWGQLWPGGLGPNAHGFELRAAGSRVRPTGGSCGHLPALGGRGLGGPGLPRALGTRGGEPGGPGQPRPAGTEQHGPQKGWNSGAGLPATVSATAGRSPPRRVSQSRCQTSRESRSAAMGRQSRDTHLCIATSVPRKNGPWVRL